jgi:hypothetical protein
LTINATGPSYYPIRLLRSKACNWWGIEERGADTDNRDYCFGFHFLVSAVCRWYDLESKGIPISAVRDFLTSHGELDLRSMHPWAFERLVAECLRHEFGPCEVHHVGVSGGGDGGIDVYMLKDGTTWLVQVKRRLNNKAESIETIRLLNGDLLREGKYCGMVVTSAETFSKNALAETVIKTPGPYAVRLIDRGGVMEMFSEVPSLNLESFLEREYPRMKLCQLSDEMAALFSGGPT